LYQGWQVFASWWKKTVFSVVKKNRTGKNSFWAKIGFCQNNFLAYTKILLFYISLLDSCSCFGQRTNNAVNYIQSYLLVTYSLGGKE